MKNKALLVTKHSSAEKVLAQLLSENMYEVGAVAADSVTAMKIANDPNYDVAVINAPIDDGNGIDLAVRISKETVCGVVLIIQSDKASYVGRNVIDDGVIVVPKPINKMLFRQSLGVVRAAKKRYAGLSEENERLKNSLEEVKLINRAKFLLMQYLSLSEERAHKYIEKQAMDMRVSKMEIARQILRTYASH